MPVSNRVPPEHEKLRPYEFHGVHLSIAGSHAVGECPSCGREAKFSVEVATGVGRCFVCGFGSERGGVNGLGFVRWLYERAAEPGRAGRPAFLASVATDRRLLSPDTAAAWGVAEGVGGAWLVPGYNAEGRLDQVYRRVRIQDRGEWVWRLLPTPGLWPDGKVHTLHLPEDFDVNRPNLYIMEGPWDGMALWEVLDRAAEEANVVAVPGCNVWRDEWTEMCRGKSVTIMFDSDHPREMVPGRPSRAGYDGVVRVAKRLSGAATSVRWLRWGPEGFDPSKPSGWDVRDYLTCQR